VARKLQAFVFIGSADRGTGFDAMRGGLGKPYFLKNPEYGFVDGLDIGILEGSVLPAVSILRREPPYAMLFWPVCRRIFLPWLLTSSLTESFGLPV